MSVLDQLSKKYTRTFVMKVTGYQINEQHPQSSLVQGIDIETGEEVAATLMPKDFIEARERRQITEDKRQSAADLKRDSVKGADVGALLRCDRAIQNKNGVYQATHFHVINGGPNDNRGRVYIRGTACIQPTFKSKVNNSEVAFISYMDNERSVKVSNSRDLMQAIGTFCLRKNELEIDQYANINVAFLREAGAKKLHEIRVNRIERVNDQYQLKSHEQMRSEVINDRVFKELVQAVKAAEVQGKAWEIEVIPGSKIRVGRDTVTSDTFKHIQRRYDMNLYVKRDLLPDNPPPRVGFMDTHLTLARQRTGNFIVVGVAPTETERLSQNGVPMPWSDYNPSPEESSQESASHSPSQEFQAPQDPTVHEPTHDAQPPEYQNPPTQEMEQQPPIQQSPESMVPPAASYEGIDDNLDAFFEQGAADENAVDAMMYLDEMDRTDALLDEAVRKLERSSPRMSM